MSIEINKEAIAEFLSSKLGNTFKPEDLSDETISKWVSTVEEEDESSVEDKEDKANKPEQSKDNSDGEVNSNEETDETSGEQEDEEEIDLSAINPDEMTPLEKFLYNKLVEQTEEHRAKELNTVINSSGVNDKFKAVLKRMADNGVEIEEIEKTIADFQEIEKSSQRKKGNNTLILPRGKAKGAGTNKKDNKAPKVGTVEFGKFLAKKK